VKAFLLFVLFLSCAGATPTSHARNFAIDSSDGLRRLKVLPAKDAKKPEAYTLCPAATDCPAGLPPRSVVLRVPLRRAVCLASAHLGFLAALDLRDRIAGVSRSEFVCDSALKAAGTKDAWKAVGPDDQIDWEAVAALKPDVILFSAPPGGASKLAAKAGTLGIPALATAEWLEQHPLGRAEWLKVYGSLFGVKARAESLFAAARQSYDSLRQLASGRGAPNVRAMYGLGWRGTWHVAGGKSYAAQLLRDAGIRYLWENDGHAGSLSLGLETVLERGRDADIWINPGDVQSLEELAAREPRAKNFTAFRKSRVYQNDARRNSRGGNDYWESGVAHPHVLLADLIRLARGGLDSISGTYYRKLPAGGTETKP
jgi:iron complex transport system substrate-binding protein